MHVKLATHQDKNAWNSYLVNHERATPYHDYAWKQSIEQAYGFDCPYLLAKDHSGSITGILPLVILRAPLLSTKLCSLPYCDLGGCLASDQQTESRLIDTAVELFHEQQLDTFEYRSATHEKIEDDNQLQNQKVRMLLNLPKSSEDLMASFKSKLRSQIKKAEKNGLTYTIGNNSELISLFYDAIANNMKLLGSPVHSKKWFLEICQNYGDKAVISIIKYGDEVAAGGLILANRDKVSIPWASTIRKYNPLAPNMLLYWSLLARSTDMGCCEFDFGRSSYGEGTFRFKQQWGAKPFPLKWQYLLRGRNQEFKIQNDTSNKNASRILIESFWCKLPLNITILLGSKIRKYITL